MQEWGGLPAGNGHAEGAPPAKHAAGTAKGQRAALTAPPSTARARPRGRSAKGSTNTPSAAGAPPSATHIPCHIHQSFRRCTSQAQPEWFSSAKYGHCASPTLSCRRGCRTGCRGSQGQRTRLLLNAREGRRGAAGRGVQQCEGSWRARALLWRGPARLAVFCQWLARPPQAAAAGVKISAASAEIRWTRWGRAGGQVVMLGAVPQ
jgi:hypothetical protein